MINLLTTLIFQSNIIMKIHGLLYTEIKFYSCYLRIPSGKYRSKNETCIMISLFNEQLRWKANPIHKDSQHQHIEQQHADKN